MTPEQTSRELRKMAGVTPVFDTRRNLMNEAADVIDRLMSDILRHSRHSEQKPTKEQL